MNRRGEMKELAAIYEPDIVVVTTSAAPISG
jgi:UDP-N-acetylmuramyl pentapeptide synthase